MSTLCVDECIHYISMTVYTQHNVRDKPYYVYITFAVLTTVTMLG